MSHDDEVQRPKHPNNPKSDVPQSESDIPQSESDNPESDVPRIQRPNGAL